MSRARVRLGCLSVAPLACWLELSQPSALAPYPAGGTHLPSPCTLLPNCFAT